MGKIEAKRKNTENREIKEITGILRKWAAFPRGRIAVLVVQVEVEVVVQQCIVHWALRFQKTFTKAVRPVSTSGLS